MAKHIFIFRHLLQRHAVLTTTIRIFTTIKSVAFTQITVNTFSSVHVFLVLSYPMRMVLGAQSKTPATTIWLIHLAKKQKYETQNSMATSRIFINVFLNFHTIVWPVWYVGTSVCRSVCSRIWNNKELTR